MEILVRIIHSSFATALLCLAVFNAITCVGKCDIVLSAQSGSFVQNSGVQSLNILASSNAADRLISLAVDVRLAAGVFEVPPGTFNQAGQIGFGNLDVVSSFSRSAEDSKLASLSLDFSSEQLFPASDGNLATIRFNVNGLAIGNYNITFTTINALSAAGLQPTIGNAGSFQITAVPEQSSALLLAIVSAGMFGTKWFFRKSRQKIAFA